MKSVTLIKSIFLIFILNSQLPQNQLNKLTAFSLSNFQSQHQYQKRLASYSKYHICQVCSCKRYTSIKCFGEKLNENIVEKWKNLTLTSSNFDSFHDNLKDLFIDFHYFNLTLKIQHNTFSKMKNLKLIFLNNINELEIVPSFESAENLRELTIQNSNLRIISTEFCNRKPNLQKIDLSYNDFEDLRYVFDNCQNLALLDLSHNRIKTLLEMFNQKSSLFNLMLDNNQIEEIGPNDLSFLTELTELSISKNRLRFIHENAFDKLERLTKLDLSKNNLYSLPHSSPAYFSLEYFDVNENLNLFHFPNSEHFTHLKELRVHYAYHCCPFEKKKHIPFQSDDLFDDEMYQVKKSTRKQNDLLLNRKQAQSISLSRKNSAGNTEEFDKLMRNEIIIAAEPMNPLDPSHTHLVEIEIKMDSGFLNSNAQNLKDCSNIEKLTGSSYLTYLCSKEKKSLDFKCSPEPDPFTPCENLLEDWWLRIAVWLISLLGILSNVCVVAYNIMISVLYYYNNNDINVSNFLITNLATADSLMSIYLLFIALKDATSRHTFGQSALDWQRSFSCNLAGFLSVVSSVASALCLAFITFERYYAIRNSLDSNKRISIKFALITSAIIWVISLIAAALPLFDLNSYSAYAICLPFDTRTYAYKIYIVCLNSLLVLCFFFICVCYGLIFISTMVIERRSSLSSCNNETQLKLRSLEDQKLARNISLLVVVNIICWGPMVYICAYSLITMSPMNRAQLKILAIFVIPFNSLINPFLYCISRRSFRMYLRSNIVKYKLKRKCGNSFSTLASSNSNSRSSR